MAIRISGMYSGLETESIINELASAQSYKKNKLVKAQTKLSWKQDAWKTLNTKIYSLYANTLSNMRFESSYMKKKTSVSNTNAIKVTSSDNAANGVNTVKVDKLAKTAYLTGKDLTTDSGVKFTGAATLKTLGFTGEGSIRLSGGNGAHFDIDVTEDMTINDVVGKISETGLNASFDQANQRIFISSKNTGAVNNFTVIGNDEGGMNALASLGLLSEKDLASGEYTKWAGYRTDADAYQKVLDAEVEARLTAYQKQNETLTKEIEQFTKGNEANQEALEKLEGYATYGDGKTATEIYDIIYGAEVEKPKKNEDGKFIDADGNEVENEEDAAKEKVREGGLKKAVEDAQKALDEAKDGDDAAAITAAEDTLKAAQAELEKAQDCYNYRYAMEYNQREIDKRQETIDNNNTYMETVDDETVASDKLKNEVKDDFDAKIAVSEKVLNGDFATKAKATKIDGQDSKIMLNGAEFTSMNNSYSVNGLNFSVLEETTGDVTLTTTEDTDGIFDMIKKFFTEYNKLINEMDSLYNAESSKGYEPLISEEKDAMSESEIKEWEDKIKGSLLRRDTTLSSVSNAMKNVLLQGATVNGKQMYLSDFGINTLGYFKAAENEKNSYHIDGDADDAAVSGNANKLKEMIASDPEAVTKFFSTLSKNLYEALNNQMATSSMSSAFTVYNDKQMKSEYDGYKEKITKQEDKLNALIDNWYKKFSAMETALSKIDSKNSAVSNMFGGR